MGTICLISSGRAATFTEMQDLFFVLQVYLPEVGPALEECLPWYDALCLTGTGNSISQDISLNDQIFKKNSKYGEACEQLKRNYVCKEDCSKRQTILIEQMMPLSYDIFPEISTWNGFMTGIQSIATQTKDWFKTLTD